MGAVTASVIFASDRNTREASLRLVSAVRHLNNTATIIAVSVVSMGMRSNPPNCPQGTILALYPLPTYPVNPRHSKIQKKANITVTRLRVFFISDRSSNVTSTNILALLPLVSRRAFVGVRTLLPPVLVPEVRPFPRRVMVASLAPLPPVLLPVLRRAVVVGTLLLILILELGLGLNCR